MITETEHAIDPAHLASGQWCHRADKTIGEGDIHAAYSADCIGMGQPVRKPFQWKADCGYAWACLGAAGCFAEAYALRIRRCLTANP